MRVADILKRLHHSIAKEVDGARDRARLELKQRYQVEQWGGLTEDSSDVRLDRSVRVTATEDEDEGYVVEGDQPSLFGEE